MATDTDTDTLVRDFVEAFNSKDADLLSPFLDEEVVFQNYGDSEVRGRDQVVQVWAGVFTVFDQLRFETVHQAVNGNIVIAEQRHSMSLPGGPVAPIMNMAVYEVRDGRIATWRDYTNPEYAKKLLTGA